MTMGSYEFLHAADLHIDSPLHGLDRYEEAPVEAIRGATRRAFENLVQLAIERGVAFVVLAGDVFDGDWRDYGTGLWFTARLRELTEAGIRVYLLAGNHDAEGRMTGRLDYPGGVFRFGSQAPQSFVDEPTGAVLHGQGFAVRDVTDNLVAGYPAARPGALNVGVLHTALSGREGHAPYAPCTADDLRTKGYDYWALGHVHQREVVSDEPWIVFPGNLQARNVRETGAKGASVVKVEEGAVAGVEHVALDVVRFTHLRVDVTDEHTVDGCLREVRAALGAARDGAEGRLLSVRVELVGRSRADAALRRGWAELVAGCRDHANAVGELWIEKVRRSTRAPAAARGGGADIVAQLELDDADLRAETLRAARDELDKLLAKLPPRAVGDGIDLTDEAALAGLLDTARDEVVQRLLEADAAAAAEDEA